MTTARSTGNTESGVLSCPTCTQHREGRFAAEHRFWRLSSLVVTCIGPRADQPIAGTDVTWAQAYTSLTGIAWGEAVRREAERKAAKQRAR